MTTPMRQQYLRIKKQYPGTIVFFRWAISTRRSTTTPGPWPRCATSSSPRGRWARTSGCRWPGCRTIGRDLHRPAAPGRHKVAIVEQVGEITNRELVEREVVRVVTPGTVVEPALLDERRNNYLAALVVEGNRAGLAYADITTGEFAVTQLDGDDLGRLLVAELDRLRPAELVIADRKVADGWEQLPGSPLVGPDLDRVRCLAV